MDEHRLRKSKRQDIHGSGTFFHLKGTSNAAWIVEAMDPTKVDG